MAKTLPDLRIVASQIKEATLYGENTADRVGGLLVDLVDYLDTLHIDEVTLGPLLTALNNSHLIDPSDGQTLTFSVIEDGWTFSSAITQLKLAQGRIEMNVASNYQYLLDTKALLQGELDAEDQRIRDNYAEYATWRDQTDTYIAQYATAYDEDGNLVAMSKIMQTADEAKSEVEALETRVTNIADPEFWEQGTTSNEEAGHSYDSSKEDSTKVIRTVGPFAVTLDSYLTFTPENNPFSVSVLYFNTYKEFCDSATGWSKGWCKLDEQENGKVKLIDSTSNDTQYIAIKIKKNDDTDITIDDVKEVGLNLVTSNITSHSELKQTADAIIARVEDDEDNIAQLSIKADKIESNVKAQSGSNRIPKANTFTGDAKTSEIFYLPKGQYVFQVRDVYNGVKLRGQTEAERDKSSATFSGTTAIVPNGTFSGNTLVLEEDPSMYYDIFTMTSPQTIELGIYSAYYQVFTLNANYYCQVVLPAGSSYPQIEPGDTPTTFNMGGVTSESYIVQTAFEISSSVADGITEEAVSTLQNKLEPDVFKDAVNGYATFRTQTDAFIGSIAGQFNPDGTLKYYSTTEQTAQYIRMEVAEMESRITNLADPGIWEQGTTSGESAGRKYEDTKSYSSKVVRTEYVIPTSEDAYITFTPENNNYAIQVLYFNKNKVYCSSSTHWKIEWTALNEVNEGKVKIINQSDVQYVAVKLRKGDGSTDITVDDVKKAGISLTTSNIATSSEVKITATEISQTVSDGIAKEYMNNLKSLIHPDSLPNDQGKYVYATWKGQTNDAITSIAGKWDSEGNLIGYSNTEQTAEMIKGEVAKVENRIINLADPESWERGDTSSESAGKTYDETKVASNTRLRIKVLIPITLDGVFTFTPENNQYSISILYFTKNKVYNNPTKKSPEWIQLSEQEEGKIKVVDSEVTGLQYIVIKVKKNDNSAITLDDLKNIGLNLVVSDIATYSEIKQTANAITQAVSTSKSYTDELKGMINSDVLKDSSGKYAYATFKQQTNDNISQIAGKWDSEGNLIGYSNTTQTATMITSTVTSEYIINSGALDDYAKTSDVYVKSDFSMTPGEIIQSVTALEEHREDLTNILAWEQGGIDISSPGSKDYYNDFKSSSSKRIRTKELIPISKGDVISINMDASYSVELLFFNKNKSVARPASGAIVHVGWVDLAEQDDHKYEIESSAFSYNVAYVAIVLKINDTTDITVDSIPTSGISIIQQKLVTSGQIALFITENDAGNLISNAVIQADHINMTSTVLNNWASTYNLKADNLNWKISNSWKITNTNDQVILYMDSLGNMNISGKLRECELMEDLQVGENDYYIYIRPIGENNGAELVGMHNTDKVFSLGFGIQHSAITPSLQMSKYYPNTTDLQETSLYPGIMNLFYNKTDLTNGAYVTLNAHTMDSGLQITHKAKNASFRIMSINGSDKIDFGASLDLWVVTYSDEYAKSYGLTVGNVYVDSQTGYLRLIRS